MFLRPIGEGLQQAGGQSESAVVGHHRKLDQLPLAGVGCPPPRHAHDFIVRRARHHQMRTGRGEFAAALLEVAAQALYGRLAQLHQRLDVRHVRTVEVHRRGGNHHEVGDRQIVGLLRLRTQAFQAGGFPFLVVPVHHHAPHFVFLEPVPAPLQVSALLEHVLEAAEHALAGGQCDAELLAEVAIRHRRHEPFHEVETIDRFPWRQRHELGGVVRRSLHQLAGTAMDVPVQALIFHGEDDLVEDLRRQLELHITKVRGHPGSGKIRHVTPMARMARPAVDTLSGRCLGSRRGNE